MASLNVGRAALPSEGACHTRLVIWERWRQRSPEAPPELRTEAFQDLLEDAPVMALLIDREFRVVAANAAARRFFRIDPARLPSGLVEVTRESRLTEVLRAGRPDNEIRLTHHQRVMQTKLVPGPRSGETLMFLTDITQLRRLERVRQEFVANLSHELKTPITSLRLAAESLMEEPPAADRKRFASHVLKDADHVAAIVDNLRQLAEIEAGGLEVRASTFLLSELVAETLERLNVERAVSVRLADHLTVHADRAKLAQALGNLLDNAARFSPPSAPVEVEAETQGSELVIRVRDHGPGISPEHWERVFERFYKVDPSRTRGSPGSGLGLAITKHLVLVQGGRVWTEAARERGQVFGLALPLRGLD